MSLERRVLRPTDRGLHSVNFSICYLLSAISYSNRAFDASAVFSRSLGGGAFPANGTR
jgi:hypothetical protein